MDQWKVEKFRGLVERFRDGLAFLTVETEDGRLAEIEWSEEEIKAAGIHERQSFVLTMSSLGEDVKIEFTPNKRNPISPERKERIEELRRYYMEKGEWTEED